MREHDDMSPEIDVAMEAHEMRGLAELRRVGRIRFPVFELVQDGVVLASMGRAGWFKLFFGRGRRIELADGSRWRLTALGAGGVISSPPGS